MVQILVWALICIRPYFVYASREGWGESAHMPWQLPEAINSKISYTSSNDLYTYLSKSQINLSINTDKSEPLLGCTVLPAKSDSGVMFYLQS